MTLINDFLSLIYPGHCEACRHLLFKHERFICTKCRLELPHPALQADALSPLHQVFAGRIPLIHASSYYLFEKSGRVQRLVHAIKYEGQKELAGFLGELYARELLEKGLLGDVDLIIPVPLHRRRLKARGFNQSACFAEGLSALHHIPVETGCLERAVDTATQTKKKKYQRWENMKDVFELKDASALVNKHVLLVDDVITTGSTIESAWEALRQVEGLRISVASLAFAGRPF